MSSNRVKQIYEKRYANKKTHVALKYPIDLESQGNGNIIIIEVNTTSGSTYQGESSRRVTDSNERVNIGTNTGSKNMTEKKVSSPATIALFTPLNIQTSYNADWSATELGALGRTIDTVSTISNIDSIESARDFWNNQFKPLTGEATKNILAGMVQALTPFNAKDAVAIATRTIENPYLEVMFNGVQNRTFSFTFKMIPRSQEEQQQIEKIVQMLKEHRAPSVKIEGSNNYWNFPSYFNIKFYNKGTENNHMFKIKPCAMTNMEVNYSSESNFTTYKDGAPFSTEITLEFIELEILTRDDHRQGY